MRFGIFIAPFHARLGSPTVAFERDIQLVQALDGLGYSEAWIGWTVGHREEFKNLRNPPTPAA